MDNVILKRIENLTSSKKKWELNNNVKNKEITLSFIHDKNRMMRNSITMSYLEFEDLIELMNIINQHK